MKLNKDSTYVLGGYSYSPAGYQKTDSFKGNNDFWVYKMDALGNRIWDHVYGGRCQITKHLSIKPQTAGLLWVVIQIPLHRSTNQALLKCDRLLGNKNRCQWNKKWDKTWRFTWRLSYLPYTNLR